MTSVKIKIIVVNLILYVDSMACKDLEGNSSSLVRASQNYPKQIATKLTTPIDWIGALIDRHNFYRQWHNSPKLKFNYTLSLISQAWANHLAETKSWGHNHNVLRKYRLGENIARFTQIGIVKKVKAVTSVDLWYNEIKDYDFKTGQGKNQNTVGHFTQVVWKSTLHIGAAMAVRRERNKNYVYVVANYFQQGNGIGKHGQNVLPPKNRKPPKFPSPIECH